MIEINPKHPHIDFTKPVQWWEDRDGAWYDCVVSEDKSYINFGMDGSGARANIGWIRLRNTPFVFDSAVDEWLEQETKVLADKAQAMKKDNAVRWAHMKIK